MLFELLMLGVYVWQGVALGEWDNELVWFGHAMALAGAGVWALVSLPRLDVDGERILVRTALGFSFADEMAERGATGTSLVVDDWFIEISNTRVVAFRRDYLKRVGPHEGSESGDRCAVTAADGRKFRVYAAGSTLEDLRDWFERGAGKRGAAARATDALETIC